MADTKSLKKEIILILVGAIITATTAFLTSSFNAKREDKKANIEKRLELNDQLAKDLGKRLFLTYQLYKKNHNIDSTIRDALSSYRLSKEDWNIKIYSYQSLLKHYYGGNLEADFITNVYNPLIEIGQMVEYNKIDSTFMHKYIEQQNRNVEFIRRIYDLSEEK